MPRNRKIFIHGTPVELCTSIQRGLPLVPTPYLEVIIKGILAAAQTFYPITICHLVVMANHIHLLCVVKNPKHVSDFMRYFKAELAHAVNRLFGWSGYTLWEEGFDSPVILSPEKLLERMYYIYLNPVAAGLVNKSSEYPGINSYSALLSGESTEICKKIARNNIPELPKKTLSLEAQKKLASQLKTGPGQEFTLIIEPWAWIKCFPHSRIEKVDLLLRNFLRELSNRENTIIKTIKGAVIGAKALQLQDPRRNYRSTRNGQRTICLSDSTDQRRSFISWFQEQAALARESWKKMKHGEFAALPPGFFFPGGLILASLLVPPIPL